MVVDLTNKQTNKKYPHVAFKMKVNWYQNNFRNIFSFISFILFLYCVYIFGKELLYLSCLCVQVAGLGTTREVELPLTNYRSTIFFYVQRLLQLSCNGAVKTDKLRRIWEPTYT